MDDALKRLTEDFITERVGEHGSAAPAEQADGVGNLDAVYKALYAALDEEQRKLLIALENAQQIMSGQSERYYYRCGFSDAVKFLISFSED